MKATIYPGLTHPEKSFQPERRPQQKICFTSRLQSTIVPKDPSARIIRTLALHVGNHYNGLGQALLMNKWTWTLSLQPSWSSQPEPAFFAGGPTKEWVLVGSCMICEGILMCSSYNQYSICFRMVLT